MAMKKMSAALLAMVLAAPCTVPATCLAAEVPAAETAQENQNDTGAAQPGADADNTGAAQPGADADNTGAAQPEADADNTGAAQPESGGGDTPDSEQAGEQDKQPSDDAEKDDSAEDASEGLKVTTKTYKKEFKTAKGVVYKEVSFEYPVAEGTSAAEKAFNKFYKNLRTKWLKAAKEDLADAKEIVSAREDDAHYTDDVTCEITSNDKDYICVLQSGYDYKMGAHGMPYRYTYIFDVKTGKKVSAANLLGITKNQLNKKVRNLYMKKFDKTEQDGNHMFYYQREDVEKALSEVDFNQNLYYLKNGKLRFYVDPYVAGPYAAGFIEVAVKL